MSSPIRVAIVGATGRTGNSTVNGLLGSNTKFEITALARPSSLDSDANKALKDRGVRVIPADLSGRKEDLVEILRGTDVVISCIVWTSLEDDIPLAEAAKDAGVKRFVPCAFGTPAARGVMDMNDRKLDNLAAIQRIRLPYTVIHVGWWMRQAIYSLPSGRTKHAIHELLDFISGDGTVPLALTDLEDVGKYVAKIIADPATVNKKVMAYTEVLTLNQAADLLDEISGEKAIRNYVSADKIREGIASARKTLSEDPDSKPALFQKTQNQYFDSMGVRGDNTPENARYLGYLDFKELYPDVKGKSMRTVIEEVLEGH
ncbi:isoflavone reductase family protein [Xylariaceae sp. FL0016]|nr:isoflavone reductase family protein [Xylariaceae sp. FL0016]